MDHNKYDIYGFRTKPKKRNYSNKRPKKTSSWRIFTIILICFFVMIGLVLSGLSAYISWNCYANDLHNIRVIKTVLSTVFFYLYLPYFYFKRIILKVPCLS